MRQCFVFACLICLFSACDKNEAGPIRKFISLRVDGQVIIAENPVATLTAANITDSDPANDYPTLKITGTGGKAEALTFTLISETDPFRKGTYLSTQQGNGMSIKYNDSAYTILADNVNGYLSFELTKVQDTLIEGRFTGLLEDTTGTITIRPVTDGYLRAIFKRN
jgi:hypothetical protein